MQIPASHGGDLEVQAALSGGTTEKDNEMDNSRNAQLVNDVPTGPPPQWMIFKAGTHEARMPFDAEGPADYDGIWAYVLDLTFMGFRADRIGDAIVITGRPSTMEVALS